MSGADNSLAKEIGLLYSSIGKTVEVDIAKVPVRQFATEKFYYAEQNFRGGRTDLELENELQMVVHNIASLHGHLRSWARAGGRGVENVDTAARQSSCKSSWTFGTSKNTANTIAMEAGLSCFRG